MCLQAAWSGARPVRRPRARLAGAQQAIPQLGLLLGGRIPLRDVGQLGQRLQAEELEEQGRRAVEHGPELGPPRLLDDPALEQRRRRRLRVHAADAGHLGPRDRLQVGDDGQGLGLGRGQRGRARPGQEPPGSGLGVRDGWPACSRRRPRHDPGRGPRSCSRRSDIALWTSYSSTWRRRPGPPARPARGREEEQGLDGALQGVHATCSRLAWPGLRS